MKRQRHIVHGRHRITLLGQLYRENQTQNQFDWNKCKFIFVKLLGGWKYRGNFSDPQRFLCPCKIKYVLRRPPPPSSRHRVIFLAIKHNLGQFFMVMEWWWLFFSSDGMAMVLKISHHHHWWFLVGSTIGNNGFLMVFQWFFPISGTNVSRWLQTEICDKKSA